MDPVTLSLMAGTALAGIIQGQQAKSQASKALAYQKQRDQENMRFGKSARTDAYGNRVSYNDALAEWMTELSPMQQRLIKAGEHEQLLGLTEDAGRNRNVRRRVDALGRDAAEDYNTQAARFRYGPQKTEEGIFDELSSIVARARTAPDVAASRQRLRQGSPIVSANNNSGRESSAATALALRKAALDEFNTRNTARNNQFLPAMGFFREGASGGGGAPVSFSDTPDRLSKEQDSMSQLIASIMGQGTSAIGSADQALTKATGSQFGNPNQFLAAALRGQGRIPRGTQPIASSTSYVKPDSFDLDKLLAGGIY